MGRSLFPYREPLQVGGERFSAREILDVLGARLTPERLARIREVAASRTFSIMPVLEGLHDFGNVNAVVRSAEALGYGAAQVIELSERYRRANRVVQGADKWVDIVSWGSTADCVAALQSQGYRILASDVAGGRPLAEYAFDQPTAVVFGNERSGVTDEMLALADGRFVVPMAGFTRSFNISVAAALALYHIQRDRCARLGAHGDLTPEEVLCLEAVYCLRSLAMAETMLLESRRLSGRKGS